MSEMVQYARSAFDSASAHEKMRLCTELAVLLSEKLKGAKNWHETAYAAIEDLKKQGHDLWSFDEDNDFQIWCGDYHTPKTGSELLITLRHLDYVEVTWKPNQNEQEKVVAKSGTIS